MTDAKVRLDRRVSVPLLTLYGIGTMLGAGIYALVGEVTAAAGVLAPIAFLVAGALATFTATSFAELSSRYPKSAGEAVYVGHAFTNARLSFLVGTLIVLSGVVSSGVMVRAFVGYAQSLVPAADLILILGVVFVLGALAIWGIGESLMAVAIITLVEAGALILIVFLGLGAEAEATASIQGSVQAPGAAFGVLTASVLAFYAFIGFEDMVNIAEEVKSPHTALPTAIFSALAVTMVIYVAVSWTAIRTTPLDDLIASEAPMTLVFTTVSAQPAAWISIVAMFAVANGALVQVIMASRVVYGLSEQNLLPTFLGKVNETTRTPLNATLLIVAMILATTAFDLGVLAKITSFLLLTVFTLVNVALIRLKRREDGTAVAFQAPWFMPWLGAMSAAVFAVISLLSIAAP